MQKKCSLCGREKVPSRDSETKMQIRQTTRHMDEIEKTSEISTSCKQALESRITGDVERKASLKKRYLELLRNKEAVKQRLFKLKETVGETAGLEEDLQGVIERKSADKEVTVETLKHMRQILREQSHELYCLRMRSALRAFKLMPVDAQLPVRKATKMTNKKPDGVIVDLSGCSSIASLPLPNSGNYSGVPLQVLAPAISYITHLVDALAAALNVPLPHPLNPFEGSDPMVSAQHDLWARANVRSACYSLSPATHMNDRSRFLDFSWTSLLNLHPQPSSNVAHAPHAMMTHVDSKPNADTAAAKESSRKIEQEAEYVVNPNFPASLVLLQADVIALCMRAGIAPEDLYPPEAMLYNLHLLHKHCAAVVREQERRFDGTAGGLVSVVEVREPSTEVVDINPPSVEPLQTQNSVDLHSIVDRYGSAAAAREQQRLARQSGAVGGEHPTGLMEDSEDGVMIRSEFLATADTEWDMVHNVEF